MKVGNRSHVLLPQRLAGFAACLVVLALFFPALVSCEPREFRDLAADELKKMIETGERFVLVDTRDRSEFQRGRIPGAINIAQHDFDIIDLFLPKEKDLPLVFYCRGYG